MAKLLVKIGERYGKFIVKKVLPPYIFPSGQSQSYVQVLCDCGKTKNIFYSNLRRGKSKSCGCTHSNPMWKDRIAVREWMKKYYQRRKEELKGISLEYGRTHKDEKSLYMKERYLKNIERFKEEGKIYRLSHLKEKSERDRRYRIFHQESLREKRREKLKNDIQFRLSHSLRARLRHAIRFKQKKGSAVRDLGCTVLELKNYLEGKFKEGMSWKNWTWIGWHIDHIVPLSFFDLENREEFLKACHYTNLQPMWAIENFKKGGFKKPISL